MTEHLPEREARVRRQLPTREQVEAISDVPALIAMQDDMERVAEKITVDLEMEVGDLDWDARARSALTAYRIAIKHVARRIKQLTQSPREPDVASQVTKVEKIKASAERQREIANASRAAAELRTARALEERNKRLEQLAFQAHFVRAAHKLLAPEVVAQLMDEAQRTHMGALKSFANEIAAPAKDPAP